MSYTNKTLGLKILNKENGKGGMVVGHTPQEQITSKCDNKLYFVDTMMSEAFRPKSTN